MQSPFQTIAFFALSTFLDLICCMTMCSHETMQESVNCTGCIFQAICVKFLKDNHATLAPVSQVENVFIQSRLT